ncbi:MAG: hypothetical protein M5R36_27510 [Deltaproteobacteria bacterium]|nr:hypothetical protein [Deltaproteobacteria bacterium]
MNRHAYVFLAAFAVASAMLPGCTCAPRDGWDDALDVACDCGGLTKLIYTECSGEVFTPEDEAVTADRFAASCLEAVNDGGEAADKYRCYIEAACEADDCEEAAERMRLCNL